MSLQVRTQASYTLDALTLLKDAGAITTSAAAQVDSSDQILDLGAAYMKGEVVIDISAIEFGDTDETYELYFQLSASATFASGVVHKCGVKMGDAEAGGNDDTATGRVVLMVDNEHKGTVYRYARMYTEVGGTTASINYTAALTRN